MRIPQPRDWVRISDDVTSVNNPLTSSHLFLVIRERFGEAIVLLRTRQPGWPGLPHLPHKGNCGATACFLNDEATISSEYQAPVALSQLGPLSCEEPDDEVWEWALSLKHEHRKHRVGRYR